MKEPICKNCVWWKPYPHTKNTQGLCVLSKAGKSIMRSGCGLTTSAEFGCNQFREKHLTPVKNA